jgi:ribbon-helix-helix CopG family protein
MTETHRTSGGVELTDALINELSAEAERGYDAARLGRRPRRGRPPMGNKAASVFQVRLDPALRRELEERADAEETTPSDLMRRALRAYPGTSAIPGTMTTFRDRPATREPYSFGEPSAAQG